MAFESPLVKNQLPSLPNLSNSRCFSLNGAGRKGAGEEERILAGKRALPPFSLCTGLRNASNPQGPLHGFEVVEWFTFQLPKATQAVSHDIHKHCSPGLIFTTPPASKRRSAPVPPR